MRSFKSIAWVGTIGAAALVCYIFSLQVAQEKAGLSEVEAQIRKTERAIQTLKTELGTRGRVHQLQHWSASDFGFAAPTAGQFMADEVTLANLDMPAQIPATEAPVRQAQAPAPRAELPRAVQASAPARSAERPAVRRASTEAPPAERPLLRRASITTPATRTEARAPSTRPRAAAPPAGNRTVRAIETRPRPQRTTPRPR